MDDYRYYLPLMQSYFDPKNKWEQDRYARCGHLMQPVLERIRAEGPLTSKDFKPAPGERRGTWWDWKPAKVALELLMWRGDLMVTERRNFQRVYDLTERVLPSGVDKSMPDDQELGSFLVRRALQSYAVATERDIWQHIRAADRALISRSLAEMVEGGDVVRLEVEGNEGRDYFSLVSPPPAPLREQSLTAVHLLSPFDNSIIYRERVKQLFGFDYTLECYLPAAKRQYGYFVLPILWRDCLVGRLDPKADRKEKTLRLRAILFEPGFDDFGALLPPLAEKLQAMACNNGCDDVEVEKVDPPEVRHRLISLL
jgi:uncharacterized protein YcaQ